MDLTLHRRRLVLWVLALAAGLVLAAAGTAWAKPITITTHERQGEEGVCVVGMRFPIPT